MLYNVVRHAYLIWSATDETEYRSNASQNGPQHATGQTAEEVDLSWTVHESSANVEEQQVHLCQSRKSGFNRFCLEKGRNQHEIRYLMKTGWSVIASHFRQILSLPHRSRQSSKTQASGLESGRNSPTLTNYMKKTPLSQVKQPTHFRTREQSDYFCLLSLPDRLRSRF